MTGGPLASGLLSLGADAAGPSAWRLVLLVNLPLAVLALVLVVLVVRDGERGEGAAGPLPARSPLDAAGLALFAAAVTGGTVLMAAPLSGGARLLLAAGV